MASNNIQNLVDEIFEFVEEYGRTPFGSSNKVTLPKDQLYLLLDELEKTIPKEMERFQKTYNQRDAILQDAEKKAAEIIAKAEEKSKRIMHESSIVNQAYAEAQKIVEEASSAANENLNSAQEQADTIRDGAFHYTEEMLNSLEGVLSNAFHTTNRHYEALFNTIQSQYDTLISGLQSHLNEVEQNKRQLGINAAPNDEYTAAYEAASAETGELPEVEMPDFEE